MNGDNLIILVLHCNCQSFKSEAAGTVSVITKANESPQFPHKFARLGISNSNKAFRSI